jgi:DNA polymerase III epsilon subunit-like protein
MKKFWEDVNTGGMMVMFYDTETNGLPTSYQSAPWQTLNNWPRLISVAWQLRWYAPGKEPMLISAKELLVIPEASTAWSMDAERVHGITRAKATEEGLPLCNVLSAFFEDVMRSDAMVAHNISFDRSVMEGEVYRSGNLGPRWPLIHYCTKDGTTRLCKLPGKYPGEYKYPKLQELYTFLYKSDGKFNWHSAMGDVQCLVECFDRLRLIRHIPFCLPSLLTTKPNDEQCT